MLCWQRIPFPCDSCRCWWFTHAHLPCHTCSRDSEVCNSYATNAPYCPGQTRDHTGNIGVLSALQVLVPVCTSPSKMAAVASLVTAKMPFAWWQRTRWAGVCLRARHAEVKGSVFAPQPLLGSRHPRAGSQSSRSGAPAAEVDAWLAVKPLPGTLKLPWQRFADTRCTRKR